MPQSLSRLGPAIIYGDGVNRDLTDPDGNPIKIVRSASNHLVLVDGEAMLSSEIYSQR